MTNPTGMVTLLAVTRTLPASAPIDLRALTQISALPTSDQARVYIILGFSALVALAFVASLAGLIHAKLKNKDAAMWLNIFLTCLGYVVGILTGLLGIPSVPTPNPG